MSSEPHSSGTLPRQSSPGNDGQMTGWAGQVRSFLRLRASEADDADRVSVYSPGVEAARGAAAFAVVLFHAFMWVLAPGTPLWTEPGALDTVAGSSPLFVVAYALFSFGFLGVNLFFVVSGYCIHARAAASAKQRIDFRRFVLRRLARIYPAFIALVALLFALYGPVLGRYEDKGISLQNLISHAFFWFYNGPPASAGMGITANLWTISIEVQFYIMYALLFTTLRRFGFGRSALIFLCLEIVYRWYVSRFSPEWAEMSWFTPSRFPILRFGEWLLGAWAAEKVASTFKTRLSPTFFALSGTVIIALGILAGPILGLGKYDATDIPAAVGFTLILFAIRTAEMKPGALDRPPTPTVRALRWMGERCYSIYLVHAVIVLAIAEMSTRLVNAQAPLETLAVRLACFCVAVIGSVLAGQVFYHLLERPSHNLAKRV